MRIQFLILIGFSIYACSQGNEFSSRQQHSQVPISNSSYDSIQCSEVLLNGAPLILATLEQVQAVLGDPDTVFINFDSTYHPPVKFTGLIYGQSELLFGLEQLTIIDLKDDFIGVTKENIKVGEPIARVSSIFPLSYNNLEDKSYKQIIVIFNCESDKTSYKLSGRLAFIYDENLIIEEILVRFLE